MATQIIIIVVDISSTRIRNIVTRDTDNPGLVLKDNARAVSVDWYVHGARTQARGFAVPHHRT